MKHRWKMNGVGCSMYPMITSGCGGCWVQIVKIKIVTRTIGGNQNSIQFLNNFANKISFCVPVKLLHSSQKCGIILVIAQLSRSTILDKSVGFTGLSTCTLFSGCQLNVYSILFNGHVTRELSGVVG